MTFDPVQATHGLCSVQESDLDRNNAEFYGQKYFGMVTRRTASNLQTVGILQFMIGFPGLEAL